ncbi:hypothetical protein [Sorangium atrum]|uniref:Uncharacterized protein n=1 Tax=Sorangium atrum TaxID=2995308 RepID=A0ABT5BRZ7_9BACT|nr:hypothetical protein [Sorangium aterium]MDC0676933.1 hypothetical protein [Sorangium aterium]
MSMRLERRARLWLASSLLAAGSAGCAEIVGIQLIDEQGVGGGSFSEPGYTCQWAMSFGDAETTLGGIAADEDGTLWLAGGFKGDLTVAGGAPLTAGGVGKDVFVAHLARDGNHIWSGRFGNAENDTATHVHQATAITLGGGSVYVAGGFTGSLSFGADCGLPEGAGEGDAFVARLDTSDPDGVAVCVTHGSSGLDEAKAVAAEGDRVFVLTSLQGGSDIGFSSYDGQTLLNPCSGVFAGREGARYWPRDLRVASGDAFVASDFEGRVNVGFPGFESALPPGGAASDGIDAFLASFPASWICDGWSAEGADVWYRHYSALRGDQRISAVALHEAGVVLTGSFDGQIDLTGEIASTGEDGFAAHLDRNGVATWAKQLGGSGAQSAQVVGVDELGKLVVAGQFEQQMKIADVEIGGEAGEGDAFLARLRATDGEVEWLGALGGPALQRILALAVSGTDVFLAGTSSADFALLNCPVEAADGQLFVAKLSVSSL